LGNRTSWRIGKFYQEQVAWALAQIGRFFSDQMTVDAYLQMKHQLGQEPDPDEMPVEVSSFPLEIQEAFVVHAMLPDRWDGASGSYFGKDWSPLNDLLDIQGVEDKKTTCFFLKHIEGSNTININAELKRKQDADKRRTKAN
jgi:hypothetical protein